MCKVTAASGPSPSTPTQMRSRTFRRRRRVRSNGMGYAALGGEELWRRQKGWGLVLLSHLAVAVSSDGLFSSSSISACRSRHNSIVEEVESVLLNAWLYRVYGRSVQMLWCAVVCPFSRSLSALLLTELKVPSTADLPAPNQPSSAAF